MRREEGYDDINVALGKQEIGNATDVDLSILHQTPPSPSPHFGSEPNWRGFGGDNKLIGRSPLSAPSTANAFYK